MKINGCFDLNDWLTHDIRVPASLVGAILSTIFLEAIVVGIAVH